MNKSEKIYVSGVGMTAFGELWEYDLRKMAFEATIKALNDSHTKIEEIDAIYVSNMNASMYTGQGHLGSLIATELGVNCPAYRVEGACASGSIAIHTAKDAMIANNYKNILVVGVEKMTDVSVGDGTKGLSSAADEEWESFYGVTFPSLYAMMAREHMRKYGTTKNDLGLISIKNHENGKLNPLAHFQRELTMDKYLNASNVASPLGLMDCSPISDGAAAIILSTKKGKYPVTLEASEIATSSLALHDRKDITTVDACVNASKFAYKKAGIKPSDIDIAEVHDCFTIAEILAYEDLGFAKKGEGAKLIRSGKVKRDGDLPINTSGGLKACGHPIGATGVKQALEITLQLSGNADKRQVKKNLKYGLTHNVGGSGATCVINIFKKN